MNWMRTRCWAAAAMLGAVLITGCQQWTTYPPVEITQRFNRPAAEPVPTVIAVSVQYARDNYLQGQELAINLPEGTPHTVYERVFERLGWGQPMTAEGQPAIHVKEVRTRGTEAQVDLVYTRTDGFNQLATLKLKRTMVESWRVTDSRRWNLRAADISVPGPNYVPPPVEPEPETESQDEASGDGSENAIAPAE